ncbi:MAG: hypothetical protein ACO3YM_06110 [Candidatus Kapaibacteriota bacterium]
MSKSVIIYLLNILLLVHVHLNAQVQSCLFRNPLCFYSTDILSYLQILHKNSRYEEMLPFLYEPSELQRIGKNKALTSIENMNFGYEFRRVGIIEEKNNLLWTITFQRVLFGSSETFRVRCRNVDDSTRLLMNSTQRKLVFYPKRP